MEGNADTGKEFTSCVETGGEWNAFTGLADGECVVHKRETSEGTLAHTPDGKRLRVVKKGSFSGVGIEGAGSRDPVVPAQDRPRLEAVQFRKGEKPAPDAGPDKPPRSPSTSLAIFLALVGLVALIILALIM